MLELGIYLLVPFSEGLGDVGEQILHGEVGTGSDTAMVMTQGQWNNIYSIRNPRARSKTNGLWHLPTSSQPLTVLAPLQIYINRVTNPIVA